MPKKRSIVDDLPLPSSAAAGPSKKRRPQPSSSEEDEATLKTPSAAGGPSKQTESETDSDTSSNPASPLPIAKPKKENPRSLTEKKSADTSRADDISLLNAMIRYTSETGTNPSSDLASTFQYMKAKKVALTVSTKKALGNKMLRLKKKYKNMVEKKDREGDNSEFVLLGEKIWNNPKESSNSRIGKRGNTEVKKKKKKKGAMGTDVVEEKNMPNEEMWKKYPLAFASMVSSVEESKVIADVSGLKEDCKEAMKVLDEEKLKQWEARWKQHKRVELDEFVKKSSLLTQQLNEVLGCLKSRQI
ncbi:hypothetical protein LINGRAHAP2_LOCUS14774 [Linum grandiflorum]